MFVYFSARTLRPFLHTRCKLIFCQILIARRKGRKKTVIFTILKAFQLGLAKYSSNKS